MERVGGSEGEVTVQYATKDQEAIGGKDYESATGTLTFADGDATPEFITSQSVCNAERSARHLSLRGPSTQTAQLHKGVRPKSA